MVSARYNAVIQYAIHFHVLLRNIPKFSVLAANEDEDDEDEEPQVEEGSTGEL